MSAKQIGITGASGFIGARLVAHFAERGWTVRALQRDPSRGARAAGVTRHGFRLPDLVNEADFAGLDAVVHAAVQEWRAGALDADAANRQGTRRVIAAARAHGAHLVFLSTLSAHDGAVSHYGRSKLELERMFDSARDTILRLGLVMDRSGGLFGSIAGTLRSAAVVPLVDGGRQPIQTLAMEDLLRIVEQVAERRSAGSFDVADPVPHRMRDLYEAVLRAAPRRPLLVPVPLGLVAFGAGLLEALRVPAPVTRENVLGLKALRAFDTAPSLARLGVTLEPFETCAARLLGGAPVAESRIRA